MIVRQPPEDIKKVGSLILLGCPKNVLFVYSPFNSPFHLQIIAAIRICLHVCQNSSAHHMAHSTQMHLTAVHLRLQLRSSRSESNRQLRATCTKTAAHTWHAEAIWTLLLF